MKGKLFFTSWIAGLARNDIRLARTSGRACSGVVRVLSLAVLWVFIFSAAAFSTPVNPGLTGINTSMPNPPTVRMSSQPYAYPTNRWWGSAYINNANNAYHLAMSLGTAYIKFESNNAAVNDPVGYRLNASDPKLRPSDSNVFEGTTFSGTAYTGFLRLCVSSNPVLDTSAAYTPYHITPLPLKVTKFSDWGVTVEMRDSSSSTLKMTTTFIKGGVFVYSTFSPGTYPDLRFIKYTYTNDGGDGSILWQAGYDGAIIRQKEQWFGIYLPSGTTYSLPATYDWLDSWSTYGMRFNFPPSAVNEEDRYVIVAYLGNRADYPTESDIRRVFLEYRRYAYTLITDTKVSYVRNNSDLSITTTFQYSTAALSNIPAAGNFVSGKTLFALYPHQWGHLVSDPSVSLSTMAPVYNTLRGKMKVYSGNSFQTNYEFNGIVPFLTYEVPKGSATVKLQTYIDYDKTFNPAEARKQYGTGYKGDSDTYYHGKAVARAANLIPIFHQKGDFAARDSMIKKLKAELADWYQGSGKKSFKYDTTWGGIIGSNLGIADIYGISTFNDHHFHYGYFIYASAILSMFDSGFVSQYGGIVDLLVRDIASPDKGDQSFPFLRQFDVYEGHSWANGKGSSYDGGDDGNDQEAISEAMNAWAGIYLWGIASGNDNWVKLGMYGYTTESKAAEEYYFDVNNQTYPSAYAHRGGILYDGSLRHYTHWTWTPTPQEVYGIWVLPLTPSTLYLGYSTSTAQSFYQKMLSAPNQNDNIWKDIFLRYKALFNASGPSGALADWENANLPVNYPDTFDKGNGDDGSSLSFSYHFINFFNALGTVDTTYYANKPSFLVMDKGGVKTYIAYNYEASATTFTFTSRSGGSTKSLFVPSGAMAKLVDGSTGPVYYYGSNYNPPGQMTEEVLVGSGAIKWSSSTYKNADVVSKDYIDISLNYISSSSWKAIIYTDNKASVTVSTPLFSGNISSSTPSGLVPFRVAVASSSADKIVPMKWRVVETTLDPGLVYDNYGWNTIKDISSFAGADLNRNSAEVMIMSRDGVRYSTSTNVIDYGNIPPEWKLRLYFKTDFSSAGKTDYKANIVIEYFNE